MNYEVSSLDKKLIELSKFSVNENVGWIPQTIFLSRFKRR